jgi:glycerol uptake facilitator-like aquaporin
MNSSLPKQLLAEAVGTMLLLAVVIANLSLYWRLMGSPSIS